MNVRPFRRTALAALALAATLPATGRMLARAAM